MTPEHWGRLKDLVAEGLERQGDARARFVEDACAGDRPLRTEVWEMIACFEQAGTFMSLSALDLMKLSAEGDDASLDGHRLGAYRIVRELGHGGMGTVYLAVRDDDAYRKEVALKVVKRGMDAESIIGAFKNERQILAMLDHSNIARLLDGGTTDDGRPYFVMDYVEGLPLDTYCDTHTLQIDERLKLFRIVCSAVHYAHQQGVIHGDLKPDNILVSPRGVPKLLDFGIAKVLNPELSPLTAVRTTIARPLTPAYASPEQVQGDAIAPASDVYSLGVLLYELLTGRRPYRFEGCSPQDVGRVICEEEPAKPSTVIRRTLGDLDDVVLMALRKAPGQRYASVDQLSEELGRYLDGRPILARKPTLVYRATKLIGRNRATAFTLATSILIILALSAVAFSPPTPCGNAREESQ